MLKVIPTNSNSIHIKTYLVPLTNIIPNALFVKKKIVDPKNECITTVLLLSVPGAVAQPRSL